MPTVPVLNDESVNQEALPSARLTAEPSLEALGGGESAQRVVAAGAGLANTAGEIYDRHQAYADQMFASQASEQFKNIKNNLLYNPDDGLQTQKGQKAFNAPEQFQQRFNDDTQDIIGTASNDRQRKVLENLKNRAQAELNAQVQKHVYTETQAFYKETTDASVQASINDAVDNYHDFGAVASNADDISHSIEMYGRGQGWSDEQIQVAKTKQLSKLHSDVIDRMVNNGEDLLAKNYYDHVHVDMTADDKVSAEKAVETGSVLGEGQRNADAIIAKGTSLSDQLAQARDITDPKVRKSTTEQLLERNNQIETARRRADEDLSRKGAQIIAQTGDFNQIPKMDIARMTPQVRTALMNYTTTINKGVQPATDKPLYYDLMTKASNEDTRDDFLQTDLTKYIDKLSDGDFKQLVSMQTNARKGEQSAQNHFDGFLSKKQIADDALVAVDLDPRKQQNKKQAVQFYQALDQNLAQFQDANNRKATNAEVQKMTDQLLTKVVTDKGYFWDTSKYKFQVPQGAGTALPTDTSTIPANTKQLIINKLKSRGISPTDDKVSAIFSQMKGG